MGTRGKESQILFFLKWENLVVLFKGQRRPINFDIQFNI